MDNTIVGRVANSIVGIPYNNINWEDIPGQPFGIASQFNLFVLGDANNIVDVEGAMAVGGNFYSPRSLSVGFQRDNGQVPIGFSPDLVRYLVGNIISMKGPLVVVGHAVSGGNFRATPGSTYYIGKNNSDNQLEELEFLYGVNGGSPYWMPSDKGEYYLIPSYDVQRIVPAYRIISNLSEFFKNARKSIEAYKKCIEELNANGTITSNSHEWILSGNDPKQNVFTIDVRPNGLINKGIRFNIPQDSVAIVRFITGPHAHLQYGLYGEEDLANQTLYVFEDATNIHMEKSSDIWGSVLAPQATYHGHPTGGRVSGNAVLGGLAVKENSGFEFHLYPFVGGIVCGETIPSTENDPEILPEVIETPIPAVPITDEIPIEVPDEVPEKLIEEPEILTEVIETPIPEIPIAIEASFPNETPIPEIPVAIEVPEFPIIPIVPIVPLPQICPEPLPCPACPEEKPCPEPTPCPTYPEEKTCPICPEVIPCPECPEQITCPICPTCPPCPECTENETEYIAIPIPVPVKTEQNVSIYPVCENSLVTPGIIEASIIGCDCCRNHEWDVMLYQKVNNEKILIDCITICHLGYFRFKADYNGCYILKICPRKRNCFTPTCKPKIVFKNIGVANFMLE